jgi:hypothetical protein
MIYEILYWGPTVLTAIIVVGVMRWVVSRYAKLFAMQAENAKAQTAASLRLAQALERVAVVLEKRNDAPL